MGTIVTIVIVVLAIIGLMAVLRGAESNRGSDSRSLPVPPQARASIELCAADDPETRNFGGSTTPKRVVVVTKFCASRIDRAPHGCNISHCESFNRAIVDFLGS